MGDRCYTEIVCRKSDYDATLHEYLPESEPLEPGVVQAWNCEANGGLLEERQAWAEAGIPFYGEHAPCVGAYEGAIFASDGKVHVDTLGVAGQPVARMNRNLEYEMVDDEEARRYWNVFARAEQLIHGKGKGAEADADHSS
ncbi:MAG: hypothetical protein AMXMBFR13_06820 [Phycisphaerae bacterium]